MRPLTILFMIVFAAGLSYAAGFVIGRSSFETTRGDATLSTDSAGAIADRSSRPEFEGCDEYAIIPLLATEFESERGTTLIAQWLYRRRQYAAELAVVAGDNNRDPDDRALAVNLIGELQFDSAIPTLVENLDFEHREHAIDEMTPLNSYPCARALHRFGLYVVPLVIDRLARYRPSEVTDIMVAIRAILLLEIYDSMNRGRTQAIALLERFLERHGRRQDRGARSNVFLGGIMPKAGPVFLQRLVRALGDH